MTERNNIRRIGRGLRADDATIPTVEPVAESNEPEATVEADED